MVSANGRRIAIALMAAFSAIRQSAGQEGGQDYLSTYYLDEVPVVLTATRLVQSLDEAPAAITVIDRDMIEASGAKEIPELFRLVPGMEVGYRRGYFSTVSYHGMTDEFSRGMEVLVDGHSIYQPSFGGVAWFILPVQVEDIERVEVIRGPNAAAYGPKSFMGVINIITSHAAQTQGATASVRIGEDGYRRGMARYGGAADDLDFRITVAHQEDDGFQHIHDSQRSNHVQARADYRLTPSDYLLVNFGYSEGPKEIGSAANPFDPERYEEHTNVMQQVRWEHYADSGDIFVTQLAYNRQDVDDDFTVGGVRASNDQLSERLDLEFQHTLQPGESTRLVWGLGGRMDRAALPFWWNTKDDKVNFLFRVFGNFEWRFLENFTLNFGALLEKNNYSGADVSPRLALSYKLNDHHSFRLIGSRSLRTPNIGENRLDVPLPVSSVLPSRYASDREVEPEEALTVELGHHGQFLDRTLTTDLKLAWQRFNRLVTNTGVRENPVTGDRVLLFGNGDSADTYNAELQVDYRPDRTFLLHFGYSWLQILGSDAAFDYNSSAPTNNLNILVSKRLPHDWRISTAYYYRSAMKYIRSVEIDEFQRLDLVVEKSFRLSERQRLSLAFIHQNALGTNEDFVPENQHDDRSLFEVSYRFE